MKNNEFIQTTVAQINSHYIASISVVYDGKAIHPKNMTDAQIEELFFTLSSYNMGRGQRLFLRDMKEFSSSFFNDNRYIGKKGFLLMLVIWIQIIERKTLRQPFHQAFKRISNYIKENII